MGSCASSSISISSAKPFKRSSNMDSDIPLQYPHQKSISSGSHQSQKDKGEQKTVRIRYTVCGDRKSIEKVQAASIDRSKEVKKLNMLEDSCSDEQNIVFRYCREGIGYNVPELGSPENSSILKRRKNSIDRSPEISTADSTPTVYIRERIAASIKPLRPYVNKVPKFIR